MSVFKDDGDQQRWFVRQRWWTILRRPLPDSATQAGLLGHLQSLGADDLEGYLQTSQEASHLEANERAIILAGPQTPGSGSSDSAQLAQIQAQLAQIQASLKALTDELHTPLP